MRVQGMVERFSMRRRRAGRTATPRPGQDGTCLCMSGISPVRCRCGSKISLGDHRSGYVNRRDLEIIVQNSQSGNEFSGAILDHDLSRSALGADQEWLFASARKEPGG